MKIIKLKQNEFNNLEALLKRAKLVDENDKTAHPHLIYVNKKTYSAMKRAIRKEFKKAYPFSSKRQIDYSVGMYLLNLGPNELKTGGSALPYGYAIVLPFKETEN
jgi:hypothetical protein